jgi:hypothetical protein
MTLSMSAVGPLELLLIFFAACISWGLWDALRRPPNSP